jgi:hypothetical protein
MSRFSLAVLAAALLALVGAAGAVASRWPSDPRICGGTVKLPAAQCVAGAAKIAVIRAHGNPVNRFVCTLTRPLRATCPAGTVYRVVFSKSKGRWWVKVTP